MEILSRQSKIATISDRLEDAGNSLSLGQSSGVGLRAEYNIDGAALAAIAQIVSSQPDVVADSATTEDGRGSVGRRSFDTNTQRNADQEVQSDRLAMASTTAGSSSNTEAGNAIYAQPSWQLQQAHRDGIDASLGNTSVNDSFMSGDAVTSLGVASHGLVTGNLQSAVSGAPDLIAYNVTFSSSIWWAGDTITGYWDLVNIGDVAAAASQSSLYISTDSTITTADTLLVTDTNTGVMSPGEVNDEVGTFTLNLAALGLVAGTYYVGAIADDTNIISEGDETNNTSTPVVVTIQNTPPPPAGSPDLVGYNVALSSTTWADGDSIDANWDIVNIGGADAVNSRSSLYISTDTTITTADTLLVTDPNTGAMKAGVVNNELGTFTLDLAALGLSAGTYYVGTIADDTNLVSESNETNNASAPVTVTIQSGPPILGNARNDFDDNGSSDILWRNSLDGTTGYWAMEDTGYKFKGFGVVATDLEIVATGDLDGNGFTDIVWQSSSTGAASYYMMDGSGHTPTNLGNSGLDWDIVGAGDFDGNSSDEVIWRNTVDGTTGFRSLNNGSPTWKGLGQVGLTWEVAGTGDFDGNGDDDFLWRDTATGTTGYWAMDNGSISSWKGFGQVSLSWDLLGTGDFDGNGEDDILWRDTATGTTGFWAMNNGKAGWQGFGKLSSIWDFAGSGDFDANGQDDVLWRDTTNGKVGYWAMDSGSYTWTPLGTVGLAWETPAATFDDIFA